MTETLEALKPANFILHHCPAEAAMKLFMNAQNRVNSKPFRGREPGCVRLDMVIAEWNREGPSHVCIEWRESPIPHFAHDGKIIVTNKKIYGECDFDAVLGALQDLAAVPE